MKKNQTETIEGELSSLTIISPWKAIKKKARKGLLFFLPYDVLYLTSFVLSNLYFDTLYNFLNSFLGSATDYIILILFGLLTLLFLFCFIPITIGYFVRVLSYGEVRNAKDDQRLEELVRYIRQREGLIYLKTRDGQVYTKPDKNRFVLLWKILNRTINKQECSMAALAEIVSDEASEYLYYFMKYEARENLREWARKGLEYRAKLKGCSSIEELSISLHDKNIIVDEKDIGIALDKKMNQTVSINIKDHLYFTKSITYATQRLFYKTAALLILPFPFVVFSIISFITKNYYLGAVFLVISVLLAVTALIIHMKHNKKMSLIKKLFEKENIEELLHYVGKSDNVAISALVDLGSPKVIPILMQSLQMSWNNNRPVLQQIYFNMLNSMYFKLNYPSLDEMLQEYFDLLSSEQQEFIKFVLS